MPPRTGFELIYSAVTGVLRCSVRFRRFLPPHGSFVRGWRMLPYALIDWPSFVT